MCEDISKRTIIIVVSLNGIIIRLCIVRVCYLENGDTNNSVDFLSEPYLVRGYNIRS
jgi:hypothetical protein